MIGINTCSLKKIYFYKIKFTLKIQWGVYVLMTQYLFMPQYFECKQADIEYSYNKVSKNHSLQKSPGGGGGFISGPWTNNMILK